MKTGLRMVRLLACVVAVLAQSAASGCADDRGVDTLMWHAFYGKGMGSSISRDNDGMLYVAGTSTDTWNGPSGQHPLHENAVCGSGCGTDEVFVMKLDGHGIYKWHTFYGTKMGDAAYDVVSDSHGHVYVTGESNEGWTGPNGEVPLHAHSDAAWNLFVLKLDEDGGYEWHTFYGGADGGGGRGITVDASGNVYVTGYGCWVGPEGQSPINSCSSYGDALVLKLDGDGAYQWHSYFSDGNIYVTGNDVFVDSAGSGYLLASGMADHASEPDSVFVTSFDEDGASEWQVSYPLDYLDDSPAMAVDGTGNVYVTASGWPAWDDESNGWSGADTGEIDGFVLKLDRDGKLLWHARFGGSKWDRSHGIAIDPTGSLYVTGESPLAWDGPSGDLPLNGHAGGSEASEGGDIIYSDVFVLKLGANGDYQWHTFMGGNKGYDVGFDVTTIGNGSIYVTGYSDHSWQGPSGQEPLSPGTTDFDRGILVLGLTDYSND
jgi:hypothetical protein